MRVLTAYRAMAPESGHHLRLAAFDWLGAIDMLADSVQRSCRCDTVVLTDAETTVRTPAYRFPTTEPRLMLWILEASLAYLSSPAFDRDTVFASPDTLVVGSLAPYFKACADLGLLVRSRQKYHNRPILNAIQWWPVRAQARLVRFYAEALAVARTLPENVIRWGADSEALRQIIAPLEIGTVARAGLNVTAFEAVTVLHSINNRNISEIEHGRRPVVPPVPVIDFKGPRKHFMALYYRATHGVLC